MSNVSMEINLPVSADELWEAIGSFGKLSEWHPAVETSELEAGGKRRRLSLVGGGEIVEELKVLDPDAHLYSYSILSSPLPVANYVSTIQITPTDDGKCTVQWSSEFDAEGVPENDAVKAITGIYEAGFESLKKMFGAR